MTLNTLCSLTDEALVFIEAQLKGALNSSSSRSNCFPHCTLIAPCSSLYTLLLHIKWLGSIVR